MNGQGTISGLVTDPAGAVLVGAKVTITNINTNVAVERTTNTTGYYEADALNPGEYKIEASAQGFQTIVRSGITLHADAYLDVALKLAVGNTSQVVQVTAGESLLNTESGSSGQVLTTRQLETLPASGSNPAWLLEMAPGVQAPYGQTASQDGTLNWNGVSNFGANGVTDVNEYSLDGAVNMDGRSNGINPTQDALGEMKADVSGFDASIGHTMGVSVTQTTKSGTNQIHGALRTVYQPKRWFAMDHFQGLNYRYQQSLNGCTNGASTSPACFADQYKYGL
ncbi:MAG TPA: carboxypeptidase-like regulatory domain-containing protein, partial [Acidobacteriaceae bacterium]|nr:carboxypeptidase-like regulatory domain-containing protein [Acidobacteriaceae bacterium]